MELTGHICGVSRSYTSMRLQITFEVNEEPVNDIEELSRADKLNIIVKKFRPKRSRDSNAYAWTLMAKMADKLNISKEEVYERMLQDYGSYELDENGLVVKLSFLDNISLAKVPLHLKHIGKSYIQDKGFDHYIVVKGSSEYDSKEMSNFIGGIVQECRQLGIETLTPAELKQMLEDMNK